MLKDDVRELVELPRQRSWGSRKEDALPRYCKECDFLSICRGGCPKHRFVESLYGEPGLNYLCEGYRIFYRHTQKYRVALSSLIENGLPCEYIMEAFDAPLIVKRSPIEKPVIIWVQ